MITLTLIFGVIFVLKILAIIFVCGLVSGFIPGVGGFIGGIAKILFNEGEKIAQSISIKIKGSKNDSKK